MVLSTRRASGSARTGSIWRLPVGHPCVDHGLTCVCHGEYMTKLRRYSGRIMTALSPAVPRPVPRVVPRLAAAMSAVPAPLAPMPTALAPVRDEELARQFDVTEFVRTEYPRVVSAVRMIAGDREA